MKSASRALEAVVISKTGESAAVYTSSNGFSSSTRRTATFLGGSTFLGVSGPAGFGSLGFIAGMLFLRTRVGKPKRDAVRVITRSFCLVCRARAVFLAVATRWTNPTYLLPFVTVH